MFRASGSNEPPQLADAASENPSDNDSQTIQNAGILNAGISQIIIIFEENERFCSIILFFDDIFDAIW